MVVCGRWENGQNSIKWGGGVDVGCEAQDVRASGRMSGGMGRVFGLKIRG